MKGIIVSKAIYLRSWVFLPTNKQCRRWEWMQKFHPFPWFVLEFRLEQSFVFASKLKSPPWVSSILTKAVAFQMPFFTDKWITYTGKIKAGWIPEGSILSFAAASSSHFYGLNCFPPTFIISGLLSFLIINRSHLPTGFVLPFKPLLCGLGVKNLRSFLQHQICS